MLISCLMPTRDRRPYIALAINCFLNQTHTERELLILDDGDDPIRDLIPAHPHVHYIRHNPPGKTLGAKLNELASYASGPLCANWDDDDWSHPERLHHQLQFFEHAHAAVTGYNSILYWDTTTNTAHKWTWWQRKPYACGTSQFYLTNWIAQNPMPDQTGHVDYAFSDHAEHNRQLAACPGGQHIVARYHHHSTWTKSLQQCGYPHILETALPPQFLLDIGRAHPQHPQGAH